jgi:hypothetical protein
MSLSAAPRLIALLGLLSLAFRPAAAQPRAHGFHEGDGRASPHVAYPGAYGGAQQNEVRRAVRDGRHVPLSQAIAAVRQRSPGHVLDAGMEGGPDGRALYRLRWATNDGRRIDYLVDAASGAVVGVQGGR